MHMSSGGFAWHEPAVKVYDYYLSENGLEVPDVNANSEEFYNTTAPSEDIWKKFELLPTPPRSPSRDTMDDCVDMDLLFSSPTECLTYVTDLLDVDVITNSSSCGALGLSNSSALPWPGQSFGGVKWDLLHDCMWSGRCTDSCKQTKVNDNAIPWTDLSPSISEMCYPVDRPCSPAIPIPESPVPLVSPLQFASPVPLPVDAPCVDSAVVVPYTPLSDHCYHQLRPSSTTEEVGALRTSSVDNCETKITLTNNSSGSAALIGLGHRNIILSDTPSDSDDEIDVVTVPNPPSTSRPNVTSKSNVASHIVIDLKRLRNIGIGNAEGGKVKPKLGRRPKNSGSQGNFFLKKNIKKELKKCHYNSEHRVTSSTVQESAKVASRGKNILASQRKEPKKYRRFKKSRKCSSNSGSSRSSSDSEDCEKRSQHNSMERKRRDDLRFAFQNLRENVPDLKDNPKAPKVMILNSAANYAHQLRYDSVALERTLRQEAKRKQELQRKLKQLEKMNNERYNCQ